MWPEQYCLLLHGEIIPLPAGCSTLLMMAWHDNASKRLPAPAGASAASIHVFPPQGQPSHGYMRLVKVFEIAALARQMW